MHLSTTREPFFYLATPYSKYPEGLEQAFKAACWQAGLLIKAGVRVFSPIAHTHPIAVECVIDPLAHDIWLPADRPFMEAACGLIVCMLPTWDQSIGIAVEIREFHYAGKPIHYMEPGVVPAALVQRRVA